MRETPANLEQTGTADEKTSRYTGLPAVSLWQSSLVRRDGFSYFRCLPFRRLDFNYIPSFEQRCRYVQNYGQTRRRKGSSSSAGEPQASGTWIKHLGPTVWTPWGTQACLWEIKIPSLKAVHFSLDSSLVFPC